jgi:hypothetical protein
MDFTVDQSLRPDSTLSVSQHGRRRVWSPRITHSTVLCVCGLASLLVLGCQQEEEIRRYQVPKETPAEKRPSAEGNVRLLAAILPHAGDTWFFKLVGPTSEVTANEPTFDRFLQSVRFPEAGAEPITWTVPEGWQREGPKQFRYATFHFGTKDKPLELTVFKFGGQAGSTLDNVNRWRRLDLGLDEVGPIQLGRYTRGLQVADVKGTLVDMNGPGASRPGMKP